MQARTKMISAGLSYNEGEELHPKVNVLSWKYFPPMDITWRQWSSGLTGICCNKEFQSAN